MPRSTADRICRCMRRMAKYQAKLAILQAKLTVLKRRAITESAQEDTDGDSSSSSSDGSVCSRRVRPRSGERAALEDGVVDDVAAGVVGAPQERTAADPVLSRGASTAGAGPPSPEVPSTSATQTTGTEKTAEGSVNPGACSSEAGGTRGAPVGEGATVSAPGEPEGYPLRGLPDTVPWSAVSCDQCLRWLGRLEGGNGHKYHAGCFATPGRRLPRGSRPTMVQG